MLRKTQKTIKALEILAREEFTDIPVSDLYNQANRRNVSNEQVEKAVMHFGYQWDGLRWFRKFPGWLDALCDERDRASLKDLDPVSRALVIGIGKSTRRA